MATANDNDGSLICTYGYLSDEMPRISLGVGNQLCSPCHSDYPTDQPYDGFSEYWHF